MYSKLPPTSGGLCIVAWCPSPPFKIFYHSILYSPSDSGGVRLKQLSHTSLQSTTVSIDSNITENSVIIAWQHAWQFMLQRYKPEQLSIIGTAQSIADVLTHLDSLQAQQRERPSFRRLDKIRPFLDGLKRFDDVLKIYSGSYGVVALIWGSIKLILELLSASISYFDRFVTIWRHIDQNLPRMEQYAHLFAQNEKLGTFLSLVYGDIMEFCILATLTLSPRRFFWKKASRFWGFEANANKILSNLQRHSLLMDAEANSHNIRQAEQARITNLSSTKVFQSLEVIKWLNPADSEYFFESVNRYREKDTGERFLSSQQLALWTSGTRPLLWVKGIPGCGKTVLCASLVEHFKTSLETKQVVFFFCDGTSQNKKSSTAILQSLIAQIVAANSALVQVTFDWIIKSGQERATSYNSLLGLFKKVLACTRELYLVIDALDECEDLNQTSILKDILSNSSASTREAPINIIIFSRNEAWIRQQLEGWPVMEVTADLIEHDISLYVERSLQRPPLSMIRDAKLERRIVETLKTKADGQFLWVKLMVQSLKKSTFISEISKALENLPRGLGQAYGRILESLLMEGAPRQRAGHMLLQWLVCSEKPLTMSKLSTALAIRPGARIVDAGDRVVDLSSFLEELCGSLVRITHPRDRRYDVTISFVHLTVKEYLLSSEELFGPNASEISRFRVEASAGNKYLASVCVSYLTSDAFKNSVVDELEKSPAKRETLPLLEYASSYWATHLAQSGRPDPELLRLLKLFLESEQLSTYLVISAKDTNRSTSLLVQNQGHLNNWIRQCDPRDPRLTLILDFFKTRFEKAYQDCVDRLGADHVDSLDAGYQLAQLLHARAEWQSAERLHTSVMHSRARVLGSGDMQTLDSMFRLATLKNRLGKNEEARHLQEQCLQGRKEIFGVNAPETLLCEDLLARILKEQGYLKESESLARATLIKKSRILGDDHLETIATMDNLAAIIKDVGLAYRDSNSETLAQEAFWECESLSRRCFASRGSILGLNNPETNTCLNMLGIVLRLLHRPEESESCHRQVLAAREKIFGSHNIHTQRSMRNLIAVLRDQGKIQEADEFDYRLSESQQIDTTMVEREKLTQSVVPARL